MFFDDVDEAGTKQKMYGQIFAYTRRDALKTKKTSVTVHMIKDEIGLVRYLKAVSSFHKNSLSKNAMGNFSKPSSNICVLCK